MFGFVAKFDVFDADIPYFKLFFAVSGENCDGFGGVCCHLVIVECAQVLEYAQHVESRGGGIKTHFFDLFAAAFVAAIGMDVVARVGVGHAVEAHVFAFVSVFAIDCRAQCGVGEGARQCVANFENLVSPRDCSACQRRVASVAAAMERKSCSSCVFPYHAPVVDDVVVERFVAEIGCRRRHCH